MAYIRVDKDQPTHPRMYDAVDELIESVTIGIIRGHFGGGIATSGEDYPEAVARELVRNAVLGGLVTLWCYADRHIRDDDTIPVTVTGASQICGLPVTWLEALPEEWFAVTDDGNVKLPNYCKKNHIVPKQDRQRNPESNGAKRTAKWRAKKTDGVTSSRDRHSTPLTGTGTGTVDLTGTGDRDASLGSAAQGASLARRDRHPLDDALRRVAAAPGKGSA